MKIGSFNADVKNFEEKLFTFLTTYFCLIEHVLRVVWKCQNFSWSKLICDIWFVDGDYYRGMFDISVNYNLIGWNKLIRVEFLDH